MDTHDRRLPSLLHWMNQITKWMRWSEEKREPEEKKRVPSENLNIFSPFRGPAGGNLGLCEAWPKIRSPVGYAQERDQCPLGAGFLSVTVIPLLQTSRAPLIRLSYQNVLTSSLKPFFPVCVPFPWSNSLWAQHPETGPQLPTLSSLSTAAWGSLLGSHCWLSSPLLPLNVAEMIHLMSMAPSRNNSFVNGLSPKPHPKHLKSV